SDNRLQLVSEFRKLSTHGLGLRSTLRGLLGGFVDTHDVSRDLTASRGTLRNARRHHGGCRSGLVDVRGNFLGGDALLLNGRGNGGRGAVHLLNRFANVGNRAN